MSASRAPSLAARFAGVAMAGDVGRWVSLTGMRNWPSAMPTGPEMLTFGALVGGADGSIFCASPVKVEHGDGAGRDR